MELFSFYLDPEHKRKLEVLAQLSGRDDKSKELRALINAEWLRQAKAGRVSDSMIDTHDTAAPAGTA